MLSSLYLRKMKQRTDRIIQNSHRHIPYAHKTSSMHIGCTNITLIESRLCSSAASAVMCRLKPAQAARFSRAHVCVCVPCNIQNITEISCVLSEWAWAWARARARPRPPACSLVLEHTIRIIWLQWMEYICWMHIKYVCKNEQECIIWIVYNTSNDENLVHTLHVYNRRAPHKLDTHTATQISKQESEAIYTG